MNEELAEAAESIERENRDMNAGQSRAKFREFTRDSLYDSHVTILDISFPVGCWPIATALKFMECLGQFPGGLEIERLFIGVFTDEQAPDPHESVNLFDKLPFPILRFPALRRFGFDRRALAVELTYRELTHQKIQHWLS